MKNHFSVGSDLKWQTISMYKLKSAPDPERKESLDETNIETDPDGNSYHPGPRQEFFGNIMINF